VRFQQFYAPVAQPVERARYNSTKLLPFEIGTARSPVRVTTIRGMNIWSGAFLFYQDASYCEIQLEKATFQDFFCLVTPI